MNKTELLADMQPKVIKLIGQPSLKTDVDGVRSYLQTVLSPEGQDKANEPNIVFIVVDEGHPGEAAYYRDTQHQMNIGFPRSSQTKTLPARSTQSLRQVVYQ